MKKLNFRQFLVTALFMLLCIASNAQPPSACQASFSIAPDNNNPHTWIITNTSSPSLNYLWS